MSEKTYTEEESAQIAARRGLPRFVKLALRQEGLSRKAKEEPKFKFYNLYSQVLLPDVAAGPLTEGVRRVSFFAATPLSIGKTSPAVPVVRVPSGAGARAGDALMAAASVGKGRVFFSADAMVFQPFRIEHADNAALLVNVMGWLLNRPVTAEMRESFRKGLFLTERDLPQLDVEGGSRPSAVRDDTAALQARIDALAANGGGVLAPAPGRYVVGGLELKSGVELRLGEDVTLVAADAPERFSRKMKFGRYAMIFAEGATNVSVTGTGTIDGHGGAYDRIAGKTADGGGVLREGWHAICLDGCRNARLEGVTVRGASFWTVFLRHCDGVTVRGVRIRAHANYNNDGIDISSRNVLVEDCDVDSEDDAIVFKAADPETVVENVLVRRCRLSTNSTFVKTGTETYGTLRDIVVEDCDLEVRTPIRIRSNHLDEPGVTGLTNAISGLEFNVVDGGSLERMTVRNIRMGRGVITPLSLRLARRNVRADGRRSFLRDVTVENVRMSAPAAGRVACSLTGLPDLRPENIVVRNCGFIFPGGGTAEESAIRIADEREKSYPSAWYAFGSAFPAYAFYVRNADVRLDGNDIRVLTPDARDQIRRENGR